jgi:hypothetical protein
MLPWYWNDVTPRWMNDRVNQMGRAVQSIRLLLLIVMAVTDAFHARMSEKGRAFVRRDEWGRMLLRKLPLRDIDGL